MFRVLTLRTVTVKVEDKLRKKMGSLPINWSQYIREAIAERIEREERRKAAEKLLESLQVRERLVPKGFINEAVRETRRTR